MKPLLTFFCLILLSGCASSSNNTSRSVYGVRFYHDFHEVHRPYGIIGTIEATSPSSKPVFITRHGLRRMAAEEKADAVLITYLNPNPEDFVFYTAPNNRVDLSKVSTFQITKDRNVQGSFQTTITAAGHNPLPLTAVFIRYLD